MFTYVGPFSNANAGGGAETVQNRIDPGTAVRPSTVELGTRVDFHTPARTWCCLPDVCEVGALNSDVESGQATEPVVTDVGDIRRALDRAERLRVALSQIVFAVGMNLELADFFGRVVEIVRDATDADGAFLHLWDSQRETLVLTAATEGVEKSYLHRVEVHLGQGLSGLAALRQRTVVVNRAPAKDPHFQLFPELNEENYESTAKIPLLHGGQVLIGVLSLNARTPNRFEDSHLAVAKELAALLAGVISNASNGGAVARRAHMLDTLSELSTTLCSLRPAFEVLGTVANAAVAVLEADLCVLVLADPETGEPIVRAIAPFRSDVLDDVATLTSMQAGTAVDASPASTRLLRYLNSELPERLGNVASVPLVVGDDSLGFLSCYRRHRFSDEDHDLMSIIGRQLGLALTDPSSRWGGTEQSSRVVFERLGRNLVDDQTASIATALGANLTRPLVLLRARVVVSAKQGDKTQPSDVSRATASAVTMIRGFNPGSITHVTLNQIYGLVEVAKPDGDRRLQGHIQQLADDLAQKWGVRLEAGISRMVLRVTDLPTALREASEALEIGAKVGDSPVNHYDDLAGEMHLYRVAVDPAFDHDPTVMRLHQLLEYDRRRGSQLLSTLDVYLSSRGNGSHAADELGIHRNTLRQRLERITVVTGLDLDSAEDWLPLQLAVRIVTIRHASRPS